MPEEILQAGQDVLENLDWEIRFLEKQRLSTHEPEELAKIEADLKRKKADYRAVVERLDM